MLELLNKENFDEVFNIMQESFPEDERRSYDEQKKLLEKSYYNIYILKDDKDCSIKGFVAIYDFEKFVFLEHFAVSTSFRNQGLGAKILNELLTAMQRLICLEVELPNTENAARRIGFYKRNGFFLNNGPYVQPALGKGKNPLPMKIMSSGRELSSSEFEFVKNTLHKKVYGYTEEKTFLDNK